MPRETWFVLEDGSAGDPREISTGADGKLRHKDGRAVAYSPHGPRSRGVDPAAERAKEIGAGKASANDARKTAGLLPIAPSRDMAATEDELPRDDREMKPVPSGRRYRTR